MPHVLVYSYSKAVRIKSYVSSKVDAARRHSPLLVYQTLAICLSVSSIRLEEVNLNKSSY